MLFNFRKKSSHIDLGQVSEKDLIEELLKRPLVDEDGFVNPLVWKLRVMLGIIPCVDSVAVRDTEHGREVLAAKRVTGPYLGKWCVIGGIISKGESIENSLRRHWKTDLGCEISEFDWRKPDSVHQHSPLVSKPENDFLPEPTKFSTGIFYKVKLLNEPKSYGSTKYGGQEVGGYEWFSKETLPPAEDFAYGFYELFKNVLSD